MTLDPDRVAAFYSFMVERECIRLRRLAGLPREQWTSDPIFQSYSFTNVKREHDRTTTLFKQIYDEHFFNHNDEDEAMLFLNCALYRFFGTIASARAIGWVERWDAEQRARLLHLGDSGQLSFTSAYIVSSGGRSEPKHYVVVDTIDQLWKVAQDVVDQTRWEDAIRVMCRCYGVGSFMAKEVYLDYLLAAQITPEDWETWTPVGPGARRGAGRIKLGYLEKINEDDALEVIREVYAAREEYWPMMLTVEMPDGGIPDFVSNVGLAITDVQFQFCESDKYARVAEGRRPKRLFRPTIDEITRKV